MWLFTSYFTVLNIFYQHCITLQSPLNSLNNHCIYLKLFKCTWSKFGTYLICKHGLILVVLHISIFLCYYTHYIHKYQFKIVLLDVLNMDNFRPFPDFLTRNYHLFHPIVHSSFITYRRSQDESKAPWNIGVLMETWSPSHTHIANLPWSKLHILFCAATGFSLTAQSWSF